MTTLYHVTPSDTIERAAAFYFAERAKAEIRLLAAVCPHRRYGVGLARREGIDVSAFWAVDARAIWIALEYADATGRAHSAELTIALCRDSLLVAGRWDDGDAPTPRGSRWTAPALANLFTAVWEDDDAVRAMPLLARRVLAFTAGREAA